MKSNEIIKNVLKFHNELIFVFDIASKQISDIYKGPNKYKDIATIDELLDIFENHFDLKNNHNNKFKNFLANLNPVNESFEFKSNFYKNDDSIINIVFKALPIDENRLLFSISNYIEETLSLYDDLTKCYTEKAFISKLQKTIESNKEFVLMKIDVDDFKEFNAKYGHMFGDMLLIEIASIIKATILNNGYVARVGGDQFLVLIYISNDYDMVHEACRSLRIKISTLDGSNCVKNAKFTATIGSSQFPKDGSNAELLLKKVDSALIRGKGKGKNCFIMYTEEKCGVVTLDDDIKYISKRMDTYNSSITNYNIIYGIIEVLNRKSYIKFNFEDSISLLGNFFMLDRISLIVMNPETEEFDDQIVWNNPLYPAIPLTSNPNNVKKWRKSYDSLKMIKIDEIETASNLEIYDQLVEEKTKSILAFELLHEDKIYGQVRFDMIQKNRFWQPQNVSALALISKMYAIKLSAEYLNKKHYKELYIDKLTGLYNYSKWLIEIQTFYLTNKSSYSILAFEICDFVSLITAVGAKKCDSIILKLSEWLKMQTDDITCRVRGEMFAIITKDNNIESLKERAKDCYRYVTGTDYTNSFSAIRISCGAYIAEKSDGPNVSVERAFLALNACEGNQFILYTEKLYDDIKEQTMLELHLDEALENNEFLLYLQPKIDVKTGKIGGAEALTRWNYKFETILQPYKFIPLFERTGYITKLDYNVFENVCRFLRNLLDTGKKPVPISVNVSRYTIDYDNYISTINMIRKKYNIPIELIELEITEGMYTENVDDISKFVEKLRKEGYAISIDDFGSGYSNLNNIANLDFEVLKLDKSLCNMTNKRKEIILDAIISIAKKSGHIIVCEGVEDKEMYENLAKKGADLIQGYYFDKPLEREEFLKKYFS